jgi:tRNA-dihydrouridine synthase
MKFYFAPMEGITIHKYRNLCNEMFPYIDKFFSPFLVTKTKTILNAKELRDILPENNEGLSLVPQVLTNNAEDFIIMIRELEKLGYKEVNLNLGCPSGTVVSKFRGSGFLAKPEELDVFLAKVFDTFAGTDMKLSIKTRIGKDAPEEFYHLMEIYNKYEMSELIIHPRTQKDYYKNKPNLEVFADALKSSKNPVCYNGNIFNVKDYEKFTGEFPEVTTIMLGRGIICNPALAAEILGKGKMNKDLLKEFHNRIYGEYKQMYSGEKNILFRMKELWCYMIFLFQDKDKHQKKVMKSKNLLEYEAAVNGLFRECEVDSSIGFRAV